jgi:hypothetical protein
MLDVQQRHAEARGIPWMAMLQSRRQKRDQYLADEVDKCSQFLRELWVDYVKLVRPDCHSRVERCPRGPPGQPGLRGPPGGVSKKSLHFTVKFQSQASWALQDYQAWLV